MGDKKKKHDKKHWSEDNESGNNGSDELKKYNSEGKIAGKFYDREIAKLQLELVKLQYWVKNQGLRVVILFEGRDAAGKGGLIRTISEPLNPRGCRIVALEKPSDVEKTQWYFQRYVAHLPSAGEIVIFDRSWYNRAGVERVMNFCTEEEYTEFLRACPEFEKMLVRSGIIMLKYWVSVSDEEQEKRFRERADNPSKRWKLSPMDVASWDKWVEYSKAKDEMFKYTDTKLVPWYDVNSDDKKAGRLNCITHILSRIPYRDVVPNSLELPQRKIIENYVRPPMDEINFVPKVY